MAKITSYITPLSDWLFLPLPRTKKGYPDPHRARIPLQKSAQKGGYLAAFLCVASVLVKRSMLRLLVLSYGYGCASASF